MFRNICARDLKRNRKINNFCHKNSRNSCCWVNFWNFIFLAETLFWVVWIHRKHFSRNWPTFNIWNLTSTCSIDRSIGISFRPQWRELASRKCRPNWPDARECFLPREHRKPPTWHPRTRPRRPTRSRAPTGGWRSVRYCDVWSCACVSSASSPANDNRKINWIFLSLDGSTCLLGMGIVWPDWAI